MAKDKPQDGNTSELADELEKGYRIFRAFEKGLDLATRVSGLEQTERDLKGRIAKAKSEAEAAETACVERCNREQLESAQSKARQKAMMEKAKDDAEALIHDAKAKAQSMMEKAQAEVSKAGSRVEYHNQAVRDLEVNAQNLRKELSDLTSKMQAAKDAYQRALAG